MSEPTTPRVPPEPDLKTPEEWASTVRLCLRRLDPNEQPPHSVTDYPAQYAAIVEVIHIALADARAENERLRQRAEAAEADLESQRRRAKERDLLHDVLKARIRELEAPPDDGR